MRNPTLEELTRIHELERRRTDLIMELERLTVEQNFEARELRKKCEINFFTPTPLDSATLTRWVQIMGFSPQGAPMERPLIQDDQQQPK